MCGIYAAVSAAEKCLVSSVLERRLRNRGPDYQGTFTTRLDDANATTLTFTSTVMSLRGDRIVKQPIVDEITGSVFCWNGEAWKIGGEAVNGNDSAAIFALLSLASRHSLNDDSNRVLDVLRKIEGPFAFIYFDKPTRRLYYGRDRLGRRSLLVKPGEQFLLASIADFPTTGWTEVEADGIYVLTLQNVGKGYANPVPTRYDWVEDDSFISGIGAFNNTVPVESPQLAKQSVVMSQLRHHLTDSLQLRVLQVPVPPGASTIDARVAILFSGGLDCTVLARLASDILPVDQPVDLLNVAFENPRIAAQNKGISQNELFELCPDRITGRKSFAELLLACPDRQFRLITVNVPFSLTCEHRSEVIDLIYPHNTEMDLSIAFALYFAARGIGFCEIGVDSQPKPYATSARVLLSGLGADELFGGYIRHAAAFSRQNYEGLIEELKLDVSRLGKRNLGRDDRVMANWEREIRFPYLDEDFVRWAIELPAWQKCDFANDEVEGELPEPGKRVLRLLAEELGMLNVVREKKRAIQFGARTAKMESGRVKGTTLISP
ncbi:hypothetical protein QQS21_010624 [Conoideocrella luteorostrata]|uniref:Glutamine amidotransferase type-2 domain-containing protein n=1 Tax=Conoideocrella luteorostrata TaxID=1105319 RepID=A0AAJ0FP93_9HYPO|nr:hypothetical protein QQS21_010624 [Conoideocrella luteorostrata]